MEKKWKGVRALFNYTPSGGTKDWRIRDVGGVENIRNISHLETSSCNSSEKKIGTGGVRGVGLLGTGVMSGSMMVFVPRGLPGFEILGPGGGGAATKLRVDSTKEGGHASPVSGTKPCAKKRLLEGVSGRSDHG